VTSTLRIENPYDGSPVAELPFDDDASLAAKLAGATAAQRAWRDVAVAERVARVRAALGWFREHAEEVARDVTRQMGKPIVQARREVDGLLERAEHMLAIAPGALAAEVLPPKPGFVRRIEKVPLGVVLDVAAWNYPLLIAVNVVVPALVAGNAVLVKHSRRTPLCGTHFERAFAALEPRGLVAAVVLDHAATARLIADPRVGHVAFTGSVPGGREVQRAAAERFVEVGLELGGKDPAYVAEDADLAFVVPEIVDGACYNAGQSCCAIERAYVHKSRYDEFLERARAVLEGYVLGDPLDERTTLGPLADACAPAFLAAQVSDALAHGARLLYGGHAQAERFFLPTLLADCPNAARVMREESFGPLLPVARVESDAEALARMNDSDLGLTASVWTASPSRAERLSRSLEAGTVYMNRCDFLDPALAWTGFKDSGRGVTLSRHGYDHLTRLKSLHFRVG